MPNQLPGIVKRLANHLVRLGFTSAQMAAVTSDVENRLRSLLSRWGNEPLRRTLLFHGVEEANFYAPAGGDMDARALIVVGVRNSLLEDFASTREAARRWGAPEPLVSDRAMREITSDLLEFVLQFETEKLAEGVAAPAPDLDPFVGLETRYPLAFATMSAAAALLGQEKVFSPLPSSVDTILGIDGERPANAAAVVSAVVSGIDGRIDEGLAQLLATAVAEKLPFAVFPCFKGCTRNPEKLYRVINDLLNHDIAFVTPNYFLSNGNVSRRAHLLRPFHTTTEFFAQVADRTGLTSRHREALAAVAG